MRARWVQDAPSVNLPTVAWTVVARWLPKSYLLVSTIEVRSATSDDAMSVLLRKFNPDVKDTWVTQVFRCSDSYGFGHRDEPQYKREYSDFDAAKRGHSEIVEALKSGKHTGALLGYTPDQIMRLSWLRAAEWLAWPAFISQPILPILYLFWPWYYVWAGLALANLLWRFVRYTFVNYTLATLGCLFVRLKWPVMLILGVYFLAHREYLLAVLSFATPLVAMMMITLSTGMVGVVQRKFIDELLFDWDLQAMAEGESNGQSVAS